MKKTNIAWLFAVIVLSILLVVSVILGLNGYYYSIAYTNTNAEFKVGDNIIIGVEPNKTEVASFTFDGAFLPNEKIPHVIQIRADKLDSKVKIRVKAKVFGMTEQRTFDFVTTSHFTKGEDGYYYFDDVLQGGNKLTFSNFIIMPEDSDFRSQEKYVLTIVVETLDANLDVDKIWAVEK